MRKTTTRRGSVSRRASYAKDRTIHTRMGDELFYRLGLRAQKERLSPSEINRRALEAYLLAEV